MAVQFLILLVDDDPSIGDILSRASQRLFPEAEFITVASFTGATAYLDDLTGRGPRIVLLDIDLQTEQTGLDFLALLRAHPQGKYLPTIILTSNRSPQKIEEAYKLGANAVTIKPDTYVGWKEYISMLKNYWYNVATLPDLWFDSE